MQVRKNTPVMIDVTNVVILHIEKDSSALLANISAEIAIEFVILVVCATRSKNFSRIQGQNHPKHIS